MLFRSERALGRVAGGLEERRALMDSIGAAIEGSTIRRFDQQKGPDGAPWKPSIRARQQGGKTLIDRGRLRQSITHQASATQAQIGTNLIYAAIQQFGGTIRAKAGGALKFRLPGIGWRQVASVTLPARPFLGISEDDRIEIADQVERYIAARVA